jgi:hypothetical protein
LALNIIKEKNIEKWELKKKILEEWNEEEEKNKMMGLNIGMEEEKL